nr:MAG TPA: hypothetical protein [Bacteriophage sp.]
MKRGVKNWLAYTNAGKHGLTRFTITITANKKPYLKAVLSLKPRRATRL